MSQWCTYCKSASRYIIPPIKLDQHRSDKFSNSCVAATSGVITKADPASNSFSTLKNCSTASGGGKRLVAVEWSSCYNSLVCFRVFPGFCPQWGWNWKNIYVYSFLINWTGWATWLWAIYRYCYVMDSIPHKKRALLLGSKSAVRGNSLYAILPPTGLMLRQSRMILIYTNTENGRPLLDNILQTCTERQLLVW